MNKEQVIDFKYFKDTVKSALELKGKANEIDILAGFIQKQVNEIPEPIINKLIYLLSEIFAIIDLGIEKEIIVDCIYKRFREIESKTKFAELKAKVSELETALYCDK